MGKRILYYLYNVHPNAVRPFVVAQYADRSCRTWNSGDRGFDAAVRRAKVAQKRVKTRAPERV
jgi:hypothetical protein